MAENSVLHILLVCTANRCRSPMAEALLRHAIAEVGVAATVTSAGVMRGGVAAMEDAVGVIAGRGLDLSEHLSRRISPEIVGESDLIFCMELAHVREIAVTRADALERTFTLKEFLRRAEAVPRKADQSFHEWVRLLSFGREVRELLKPSAQDDIGDPIGRPRSVFETTASELEDYARRVAALLKGNE